MRTHGGGRITFSRSFVIKRVNVGQIAAHDDAVRRIGAELNSYGVVVRYEQRADRVRGKDRKRTDLELSFDGKRVQRWISKSPIPSS